MSQRLVRFVFCTLLGLTGVLDALLAALNQLVDGLTGLERILTTPIPFSYAPSLSSFSPSGLIRILRYSIHLWVVTIIYCLALVVIDITLL